MSATPSSPSGLAYRPSNAFALGFSYQHSYSNQPAAHGLSAWSLGLTSRPSDYFGFAVVGQNLLEPNHRETGPIQIPRGVYGMVTYRW